MAGPSAAAPPCLPTHGWGADHAAAAHPLPACADWNPQNDLQAMARCHRIGQELPVTVYRLLARDTYEAHLFATSSRKYGEFILVATV